MKFLSLKFSVLSFLITIAPEIASATESQAAPFTPTQPPGKEPTAVEERAKGRDYTLPMLATDFVLMGSFAGSSALRRAHEISPGLALGGAAASLGAYVASGALYHSTFDLRKKTSLSVLVRIVTPLTYGVSWAVSCEIVGTCDRDEREASARIGVLIGMLTGTIVEAAILVPDGRKPPPRVASSAFSIVPSVSASQRGGQLGVTGIF